jgi:hypothetical protein
MTDPYFVPDAPARRSTFVTVLAWLGIVWFGFCTLMVGAESFMLKPLFEKGFMGQMPVAPGATPLSPEALETSGQFMQVMFLIFTAVMALGVVTSIGLLHRRNWARILTIVYLVLNGGCALLGVASGWIMGSIPMASPPPEFPSGAQWDAMMGVMRTLLIVMGIVAALICGWLIYKLLSKPIQAEFVPDTA